MSLRGILLRYCDELKDLPIPLLGTFLPADYTLVGECYIHGFMKGEALAFSHSEARDVDIF